MGYMPVIANLAAPIVDAASKDGPVHFEAVKFGSFADMAEAFRSGHIQVAFILAPLAIALYQQGEPLRVVYIGNRHESTLVVKGDYSGKNLQAMAGKTIAVPIRFSGHHLAIKKFLREQGMDETALRLVEIPPPDMPQALASGSIDGYFVGEPFACKSLQNGVGTRLLDVEEIWPGFICNLMIVQEALIHSQPRIVQSLVTAAARSGIWVQNHVTEAAELVSGYWGQDPGLFRYAFSHPSGRFRFDLYVPVQDELDQMAQEMLQAGLIADRIDVSGIIEDRFAKAVEAHPITSLKDVYAR
jgi:NitT/TauT family transport system substrate-binding protein